MPRPTRPSVPRGLPAMPEGPFFVGNASLALVSGRDAGQNREIEHRRFSCVQDVHPQAGVPEFPA
jgi:hypothetical protein